MSALFQWDDSYSVKVAALDDQHKKLFALVEELHQAMLSRRGKDVTGAILSRLSKYTIYHFSAEEKLLEKHNYPGLETHRAEHDDLRFRVTMFQQEFDAGIATVTLELMAFLQQWLKNHICNVDRRYGDFLNARGVY
jgi:hemerythrin